MSEFEKLSKETVGAWILHHGDKVASTVGGGGSFPSIDTARKAGLLLSQISASKENQISKPLLNKLAVAINLNPRVELDSLISILKKKRLVDEASGGGIAVIGLTTSASVVHTSEIFNDNEPSKEEQASILLADIVSESPKPISELTEFISDSFKFTAQRASELVSDCHDFGFVDCEGEKGNELIFNGNLFRRDSVTKFDRVMSSLTDNDIIRVNEVSDLLSKKGCLYVDTVEKILGVELFGKIKSVGMFDVNVVSNADGDFAFVTKPQAFHKFNDPLVEDAFDLAKALVASLSYGMTLSNHKRGKIASISALLRKLINGGSVGPASAIGEDYKMLELKGVVKVSKVNDIMRPKAELFEMRLLKKDIGEMALAVLSTGDASISFVAKSNLSPSSYTGPENNRSKHRKRQDAQAKLATNDVLQALRTSGGRYGI